MSDDTEITLIQTTRGSKSLVATNERTSARLQRYDDVTYRIQQFLHERTIGPIAKEFAMGPIGIIKFA